MGFAGAIEALRGAASLAAPLWMVAAGGGGLIAALALIFSTPYLGLGLETLEQSIRGAPVPRGPLF